MPMIHTPETGISFLAPYSGAHGNIANLPVWHYKNFHEHRALMFFWCTMASYEHCWIHDVIVESTLTAVATFLSDQHCTDWKITCVSVSVNGTSFAIFYHSELNHSSMQSLLLIWYIVSTKPEVKSIFGEIMSSIKYQKTMPKISSIFLQYAQSLWSPYCHHLACFVICVLMIY